MIFSRASAATSVAYLFIALMLPGFAAAAEWQIVRMSGDVRIFSGNVTWVSLKPDRQLNPGDAIWTGHNGRVMLSSADGRVLLNPRSLVKIPSQRLPGNYTVLFQSMGTVEADVEKRNERHFSIRSPYLAAVVKGTKFSIEIDDEKTRLSVTEGVVEATDNQTGQSLNVSAGQYVATLNGIAGGFSGNAPGASPAEGGGFGGSGGGSGGGAGDGSGGSGGGGGADDKASTNNGNGKGKKKGHFK